MKFNAITQSKLKDNEITNSLSEDSQIDAKIEGVGLQAKFKQNIVSLQTDFGLFNTVKKCGQNNHVYSFWNNPYLLIEATRGLKLHSFFLGNLFHVNSSIRNNVF